MTWGKKTGFHRLMMTRNGVDIVDTDKWIAWSQQYHRFYNKYGVPKDYTMLVPAGPRLEFFIDRADMYWDQKPATIYIPFFFEGREVIYNSELWKLTDE